VKKSSTITPDEFRRAFTAVATANLMGWVLNSFVTVSWRLGGISTDALAADCHDGLLGLMRCWFRDRRRGTACPRFAAIWVKEVGRTLGMHSHLLVHVPHTLRFEFRTWLVRAVHKIVEAPDILSSPERQGGRLVHVSANFDRETRDQWNVFRYLMKGLDPEAVLMFTTDRAHVRHLAREFGGIDSRPQGVIFGKRVGNSTDIGPSALRRLSCQSVVPAIWPKGAFEGEGLAYDDRFLRAGELCQDLNSLSF
jgi:hypothetical protein